MHLDGIDPKLLQEQVSVPAIHLVLDEVRFNWLVNDEGNAVTFQILWNHPILPVQLDIPFNQLYFFENFIQTCLRVKERADEASTEST